MKFNSNLSRLKHQKTKYDASSSGYNVPISDFRREENRILPIAGNKHLHEETPGVL